MLKTCLVNSLFTSQTLKTLLKNQLTKWSFRCCSNYQTLLNTQNTSQKLKQNNFPKNVKTKKKGVVLLPAPCGGGQTDGCQIDQFTTTTTVVEFKQKINK